MLRRLPRMATLAYRGPVTVERTLGAVMGERRPPTPDEGQTLRVTGESRRAGRFVLAGLAIAVLSMATARYWAS